MKISEIISEGPKDRSGGNLHKAQAGEFAPKSTDDISPKALAISRALSFIKRGMDPKVAAQQAGIPFSVLEPSLVGAPGEDKYAKMARISGVSDKEASPKDIQGWTPTQKTNVIPRTEAVKRLERLGHSTSVQRDPNGSMVFYVDDFKMVPIMPGDKVNWFEIANKHPIVGHFRNKR